MTPKQATRLRQQIVAIRRTFAAEKKKFGGYDGSRGLPTSYYVQLADFVGGLTYTRWLAKNFLDDAAGRVSTVGHVCSLRRDALV